MVKCQPFYFPREFTTITVVAVYILQELHDGQQTAHLDGFFIIACDFNRANLKFVAPKFYQHVNFATREDNTLDLFYTTL